MGGGEVNDELAVSLAEASQQRDYGVTVSDDEWLRGWEVEDAAEGITTWLTLVDRREDTHED